MTLTTLLRPSEPVAGRPAASWALDALVVVVAAVASVPPYLFRGDGHLGLAEIIGALALVLPLLVRRLWPLPVFTWILLGAVTTETAAQQMTLGGPALLIALYTVCSVTRRRVALTAAAVVQVAAIAVAFTADQENRWTAIVLLSGLVSAATAFGLYTATRRDYLAQLHERAERLQRERDQQGELAAAAERSRIAREMHDIVAHHLTVMVALSDGAIAASASSPAKGIEVMRAVSATGRRALQDTRRLLGVLRQPGTLREEAELLPVPDISELGALVQQVRSAGLPTTLHVRGAASDIPAGLQTTVYRIVQEALTNTLKHAGPSARASVQLEYLPTEIHLQIEDDGVGAAAGQTGQGGGGLIGMRERIHAYQGEIHAGPRAEGGWQVGATLQLSQT